MAGSSPAMTHFLFHSYTFEQRRKIFLLLMAVPAVTYVVALTVWPLTQGIYFSFFDYSLLKPGARAFVGMDNYRELLSDAAARQSILTTVTFTIAAVALQLLLGLGLALLLWRDSLFHRVCLALLLIPVTMTPLVVGLVFRALLGPDFGMIGYFTAAWGWSDPRGFLGDPATALGALVAIDTWQWTPFMALILLAGLKSLPGDILEAAEADGANAWQRLYTIVLPLILPAIFLAAVLRTMDAFRVFDIVFATTNGGPGDATNVLMVYAVKQGLQFFNVGFAAAIANTAMLSIMVFSVAFILLVRRADRRANER
jgi:multiple sugar transport system permease protein